MPSAPIVEAFFQTMNEEISQLKKIIRERTVAPEASKNLTLHKGDIQESAVLIPFTFYQNEIVLLFTKRSASLVRHRGQISFPGGVVEADDHSPLATALRETCEEIGIRDHQIEILGRIDPFDSTTGYFIHPFIGWIQDLAGLRKNMEEVEKIFCIPYTWLKNSENYNLKDFKNRDGQLKKVWFYKPYEGEVLWGITARIVRMVLDRIE